MQDALKLMEDRKRNSDLRSYPYSEVLTLINEAFQLGRVSGIEESAKRLAFQGHRSAPKKLLDYAKGIKEQTGRPT